MYEIGIILAILFDDTSGTEITNDFIFVQILVTHLDSPL